MAVQVKVCGINTREAADAALRAGADFCGLVFFPKSPRHLTVARAQTLSATMRGRTRIVALFADAGDYDIEQIVRVVKPDVVQLHGSETPAQVGMLAAKFGKPVIKAIGVASGDDVAAAQAYEDAATYLMFDAKQTHASRPGGHGTAFDWTIVVGHTFKRPWFLGGGLNADNVARAIDISGASLVDVSSGVEDSPGVKNPDKIAAFVAAARNAHYTKARA